MAVLAVQGLEREKNNVWREASAASLLVFVFDEETKHTCFWTFFGPNTSLQQINHVKQTWCFVIFRLKIWLSALAVVIAAK